MKFEFTNRIRVGLHAHVLRVCILNTTEQPNKDVNDCTLIMNNYLLTFILFKEDQYLYLQNTISAIPLYFIFQNTSCTLVLDIKLHVVVCIILSEHMSKGHADDNIKCLQGGDSHCRAGGGGATGDERPEPGHNELIWFPNAQFRPLKRTCA